MHARSTAAGDRIRNIEFRPLSTPEDYAACVEIQRITWGEHFTELVPPVVLMLTQKVGGIAIGAFDERGQMAGFAYGLTGYRDRAPVHWSHMLAVRPESEGIGIGKHLKELQREVLLENGIPTARWTFDPLVARNAHLNYNLLGAVAVEYVENMYGTDTGSVLHSGLGTDRFIVEWRLEDPRVADALAGIPAARGPATSNAPIVNTEIVDGSVVATPPRIIDEPDVRIEIPDDIDRIKAESIEIGAAWRDSTRTAFETYMENGYSIDGFHREAGTNRCFYYVYRSGAKQ